MAPGRKDRTDKKTGERVSKKDVAADENMIKKMFGGKSVQHLAGTDDATTWRLDTHGRNVDNR